MSLDADLLAAHAGGDADALITLYTAAARSAATEDEQGFFLTHAYVFALEQADPRADTLAAKLDALGRL